jgi:hypothetical protein
LFSRLFFWPILNAKQRGIPSESNVGAGENLGQQLKRNASGATVAAVAPPPMATYGELFADGAMIELIADVHNGNPALMLWDGAKETIGARVEHHGQMYEPAPIKASVLQELILPTHCCPHGTTREFLAETCKLLANYAGLQEKSASLVGRFVLCSALLDAVSVAPSLTIVGPDTERGNQLVLLLRRLCRHSLPLTGVTPAGFRSLASGGQFTYLISQATMSDKLRQLLDDASCRDRRIPFRGDLLDLLGAQVIHRGSVRSSDSWPVRSIQVAMIPTGEGLPVFDLGAQHRIANEFQAKLLSFRRANLDVACKMHFDASTFTFALRDLAHSIAAATPDDTELQAEVFDLLREEDAETRADRWIDPSVIAGEAVSVAYYESPEGVAYMSDLAKIAQELLRGRGEETVIDPGAFGKRLKLLGFASEPRDARGKKLRLTEAARNLAQQVIRNFGGPAVGDGQPASPFPPGTKA